MRNINIFKQHWAPHQSRTVAGFDSVVNSGTCSIGIIQGTYRTLNAIVTETATEDDQWRIVNLKGHKDDIAAFDSVAVLGAVDDMQASSLAVLQFGRIFDFDSAVDSVIETNTQGLMRHLAVPHYHKNKNIIPEWQLDQLQDVTCGTVPGWDGINLTSHEGQTAHLMLDMQRHDDHGGLLQEFDGLVPLLESIGAVYADFDSIIVEYQYLEKLMGMLHKVMQSTSKGGVKILNVEQSEKPFKHKKVLNIAVSYNFEDGQSITILFHHPDREAKKIAPQDTLISWKILMNNRDITGAIQPNQGEGIAMPVLAGRIMKLVNQNSARFKRTQAKKAENVQALADAEQRLLDKQDTKAVLEAEIQGLLNQLDEQPAQNENVAKDPDGKAVSKSELEKQYKLLSFEHHMSYTTADPEEFYSVNYPERIQDNLQKSKDLLDRPFSPAAEKDEDKAALVSLVAFVEETIKLWEKGKPQPLPPKTYPPIEDLGEGYYQAFKNDKKIDSWTAHVNTSGEWEVSANNAQSRAWNRGFGAPRFFNTIEEMIAKYPAFAELPEILDTSNAGDGGAGNSDDADYLNKIIKGEVDFTKANEIETQLEEIGNRLPADLSDLFEQAVSSYSVYQVGQASQIH
ncbi:hypothetical protein [Acinetobacter sp. ANC 4973]|uniref:defense against restriction DarA-related protein n=1 Tax=Acinetobacter sp. ANC 4973 TaxID=1977871 RepID=UPI000A33EF85|nr:hypothetical protein [Acinetobacter sp. ANC 4973]OTG99472.1 hypothetical protein B9T30_08230 [Acinetobacter sp. ANC 4973]